VSLESDLKTALGALVDGRFFPNKFPQSPATPVWPAIRYTIVSVVPSVDLCGDGGDETADKRVQFDIVGLGYSAVKAIRDQVLPIMKTFDPPAIWDGEFNDFDPDTKTDRCTLDYLFFPSSDSS